MTNNRYKILVIEDEENLAAVLSTLLEGAGYQPIRAGTCALALTLYASHRPDLALLDLGLPDADGMRFLREVRRENRTPVIVLSARSNERDKVEALDAGANDYVTKPFSSAELLARIRSGAAHLWPAGGPEARGEVRPGGPEHRLRGAARLHPQPGRAPYADGVQHRGLPLGALRQNDDLFGHRQGRMGVF